MGVDIAHLYLFLLSLKKLITWSGVFYVDCECMFARFQWVNTCSKSTEKTLELRPMTFSEVFIVDFEQVFGQWKLSM